MDEQDWLTSTDTQAMLRLVTENPDHQNAHSRIARKLRLFACGCCRQVWDVKPCQECPDWIPGTAGIGPCPNCSGTGSVGGITDPRSRRAVEVAERYADGAATEQENEEAGTIPAGPISGGDNPPNPNLAALNCAGWSSNPPSMLYWVRRWLEGVVPPAAQANLLRCVVGNPFRPVQRWRFAPGDGITLATPTVLTLARAAYADRDWGLLPYLADALEESGCTNADLLGHLRGPGPFCRGDWAVDLLLGKE